MTRQERFNEFLMRELIKPLTICVIGMLSITLMVMYYGNKEIRILEEQLGINQFEYEVVYIPIEEQISQYIDTLLVPEREITEEVEEVEAVKEIEETSYMEDVATLSDAELLGSLMYHEEGLLLSKVSFEEAKTAHMLAGSVVIHRTNMNYLGAESIRDTIFAEGQYHTETLKRLDEPVPDYVIDWARELLQNGPIGPSDMIYQAEFEQGGGVYDEIYNQKFCCISDPNKTE